jgi:hypothetical protein
MGNPKLEPNPLFLPLAPESSCLSSRTLEALRGENSWEFLLLQVTEARTELEDAHL